MNKKISIQLLYLSLVLNYCIQAQESSDTSINTDDIKSQLQLPELQPTPTPPTPAVIETPEIAPKKSVSLVTTDSGQPPTQDMLDTIDIEEGGNWLLVRKALEDTVDAIEDINKVFTTVLEIRMDYLKKRNKADKDFDAFLIAIGFDLGDLDSVLTHQIERFDQELKEEKELTPEERSMLALVQQKKEEIKELKEGIKKIDDFDNRIDDVIMAVEQQVNVCRDYQNGAWKNFQAIKRVYDDQKAERLYQQTEALLTNMKEVQAYLQGSLMQYFDATVANMNSAISKFQTTFQSLKTQGLDLKNSIFALASAHDQELIDEKIEAARAAQRKADAKKTYYSQFMAMISSLYNWFLQLFGRGATPTSIASRPADSSTPAPAGAENNSNS